METTKRPWWVNFRLTYDSTHPAHDERSRVGAAARSWSEGYAFEFQARERYESLINKPLRELEGSPLARSMTIAYGLRKCRAQTTIERTPEDDAYYERVRAEMDEHTAYANSILAGVTGRFLRR